MSVAIEHQDILHLDAYDWDKERQPQTPLLSRLAQDLTANGFKDVGPDMVKITVTEEQLTRYIDSFIVYYYDSTTTSVNEGAHGIRDWSDSTDVTYKEDYYYDGNTLKKKAIENTYNSATWNEFIALNLPRNSGSNYTAPLYPQKFLGPNAELFSYLNPHPEQRDSDGNWLKSTPPAVTIHRTPSSQEGYVGLPRLAEEVYRNEFKKIKRLMTNPSRSVVAFPDIASGIDSEGNLRHYKEEKLPSGQILHHFWITTYKGEQFFPADVTENKAFEGLFTINFANNATEVQEDDDYSITFTGTKLSDNTTVSEQISFTSVSKDIEEFTKEVHQHFLQSNVLNKVSGYFNMNNESELPDGTGIPLISKSEAIDWQMAFTRTARTLITGQTYAFSTSIVNHGRNGDNGSASNLSYYKNTAEPSDGIRDRGNTHNDTTATVLREGQVAKDAMSGGRLHVYRDSRAKAYGYRGYNPEDGTTNTSKSSAVGTGTASVNTALPNGTLVRFDQKFPNTNDTDYPDSLTDGENSNVEDFYFLDRSTSIRNSHDQPQFLITNANESDFIRVWTDQYNWSSTSVGVYSVARRHSFASVINGYVHKVTLNGINRANKGDQFNINLVGVVDEESDTPWENTIDITYTFTCEKRYDGNGTAGNVDKILLQDIVSFLRDPNECPYTAKYMECTLNGNAIEIEYDKTSSAYMNRSEKLAQFKASSGDDRAWGLFNAPSQIVSKTKETGTNNDENYWIYDTGTIFGMTLAEYYNSDVDFAAAGSSFSGVTPPSNHTATTYLDGYTVAGVDSSTSNIGNGARYGKESDYLLDPTDTANHRFFRDQRISNGNQKHALARANVMRLTIDKNYQYPTDGTDIPIKWVNPSMKSITDTKGNSTHFNAMYSWDVPEAARFDATLTAVEETNFSGGDPIEFVLNENVAAQLSNVGTIRWSFPFARDLGTLANPVRKGSMNVYVGANNDNQSNYPQSYWGLVLSDDADAGASTQLTRPRGPQDGFDFNLRQLHPNVTHPGVSNGETNHKKFDTHVSNLEIETFKYVTDHSMGPLLFETDGSNNLGGTNGDQPWRIRLDVSRGKELVETSPYINENFLQRTDSNDPDSAGTDFEYLKVHVATEYQLLSNGDVTQTATSNDITQKTTQREPGFLGGLRQQYQGYLGATIHKNNPFTQRDLLKSTIVNKMNTSAGRVGLYHSSVDGFSHGSLGGVWDNAIASMDVTYLDGTGTVENGLLNDGEYRYEDNYLIGSSTELLNDTPFNTANVRVQKGFYRRTGRTGDLASSYPMTYTLTIADHGVVFHIKDHASHTQEGRNAFFCVQRHVDSTTGVPDLSSSTQPVHCIYASSEPPVLYSDLAPYFKEETVSRLSSMAYDGIYDIDGNYVSDFIVDEVVEADIKAFNLNEQGRFRRFVVREKDVLKPWDRHVFAGINERDSHAVINPLEQLSLNDDGQLVIQFPTRIGSYRYLFTGKEIDLIGFVDAGAVGEDTIISSDRFTVAGGTNKRRLYRGCGSTDAYGNGMRILLLQGGFGVQDTFIDTSLLTST